MTHVDSYLTRPTLTLKMRMLVKKLETVRYPKVPSLVRYCCLGRRLSNLSLGRQNPWRFATAKRLNFYIKPIVHSSKVSDVKTGARFISDVKITLERILGGMSSNS